VSRGVVCRRERVLCDRVAELTRLRLDLRLERGELARARVVRELERVDLVLDFRPVDDERVRVVADEVAPGFGRDPDLELPLLRRCPDDLPMRVTADRDTSPHEPGRSRDG